MKLAQFATLAFALMMVVGAHAAPAPTVAGLWAQTDDQGVVGAWFLFEQRNGLWIGRLVKTFKRPGEPDIDTCAKCPGEQKDARMLGLTIVSGMKRDGLKYRGGSVLDPRDGSIYHAQMDLSADNKKLSLRGYIGIPLLGQTQVWNRLPDNAIPAAEMPKEVLAPEAQTQQ